MNKIISEREYKVHNYEADGKGRILITSLMNYLEDMAIEQAEEFGVGIDYLSKNNIAWVVYKWDVVINKYAMVGEKLRVRTWPHSYRRFYAYRKYEVLNEKDEVIVTANSLWFMISIEKRRPCKINDEIIRIFNMREGDKEEIKFEKLKAPEDRAAKKVFHVRYSDIDMNHHVNNVKYISWALEAVPIDIIGNCELKELIINYEKETNYGETIKVTSEINESDNQFVISNSVVNENDEELTLVRTIWTKG